MQHEEVLRQLEALSDPQALAGMARFAISTDRAYGIPVPTLRKMARKLGRDRELAQQLWDSGVHEARLLASLVDDPSQVTEAQMESWVKDIDSWDVCDGCAWNLFDKTPFAYKKAVEWSGRPEEFVKRAAFALMAGLAVHDKGAASERFLELLPIIRRESNDERNFVRKAVNWALREIGKRDFGLNAAAMAAAREIQAMGSRSARWIAADALRELGGEKVQSRLRAKDVAHSRP